MADEKIGKIFPSNEAAQLYGEISKSVQIDGSAIRALTSETKSVLMFKIIDKKPYILGNDRKVLFPRDEKIDKKTVFAVYGIHKIRELLDLGGSEATFIEERENATTLTNGEYTMNLQQWCPPLCP